MKKIIFVFILLLNIYPCLKNGQLSFAGEGVVYAQNGNGNEDEDGLGDIGGVNNQSEYHIAPNVVTPDMIEYGDIHEVGVNDPHQNEYVLEMYDGTFAYYFIEIVNGEEVYSKDFWDGDDIIDLDYQNVLGAIEQNYELSPEDLDAINEMIDDFIEQGFGEHVDNTYEIDINGVHFVYIYDDQHDQWYPVSVNGNPYTPDFKTFQEFVDWIKNQKGNIPHFERSQFKFMNIMNPYLPEVYSDESGQHNQQEYQVHLTVGMEGEIDLSLNPDGRCEGVKYVINHNNGSHTKFKLLIEYPNTDDVAINFETENYQQFETILDALGFPLTTSDKKTILNDYKQNVINVEGLPNKLDVIYENVPPYVMKGLTYMEDGQPVRVEGIHDIRKFDDLTTILQNSMVGSIGTNEEKAVLNILKGFNDNEFLYNSLYSNPSLVKELYTGIDGDEAWEFVNILKELGQKYWPQDATITANTHNYIYFGESYQPQVTVPDAITSYTFSWSWETSNNLSLTRGIRGEIAGNPGGWIVSSPYYNTTLREVNPLDPVRLHIKESDHGTIVPAIFVVRAQDAADAARIWEAVNNATTSLGVYGALRMIFARGTIFILRLIGILEVAKSVIDQALTTQDVQLAIQTDPDLTDFFRPGGTWQKISIATDIATFTVDMLSNMVKNGRRAAVLLREENQVSAASKMDEIVLEAEHALQLKLGRTLTSTPSWNPTRTIAGNLDNPKGVVGVYEKTLPGGLVIDDTKRVATELQLEVGTRDNFKDLNKDGYKLLNVPAEYYVTPEQFWNEFNKPWMDDLVAKRADILILSDKENDLLKYVLRADGSFETLANGDRILTGFGKEIQYLDQLVQQGVYEWNSLEGAYKFVQ